MQLHPVQRQKGVYPGCFLIVTRKGRGHRCRADFRTRPVVNIINGCMILAFLSLKIHEKGSDFFCRPHHTCTLHNCITTLIFRVVYSILLGQCVNVKAGPPLRLRR